MNQGNDMGSTSQNPGATVSTSTTNSPGIVPRLMDTLFDSAIETVTGANTSLSTSEPERRTPYLQQWNLNVQQELPAGLLLELGYTGSKGTELMGRQNLNQARLNLPGENLPVQQRRPYPQFQNIVQFEGGEVSNYHGMTFRLERRFGAGFHLLTNYTWSKSMDTESRSIDDGTSPHHVSTNRALDRGLSSFDVRQRFVTSAIWELPVGPGKRFLGSARGWQTWLVGGWQANTIVQLQSGNPFSITVAGDQSNTAVQATQRPHRVGHGILPDSEKRPERWFDTGAYVLNPVNTFGNAGRNTLFEDGVQTIDLSLFKNTYFGEGRYNLQFRAEFFNLFNTVNLGRPGQVVNGANYGVVAEVAPAREIQFALKFIF
jgi:hypothetical protein